MESTYTLSDDEVSLLLLGLEEISAHAADNGDEDKEMAVDNLRAEIKARHTVRLIGVRS